MKYTIETTEKGCIETITLKDGTQYSKRHTKTDYGSTSEDDEFYQQMEKDHICEEVLDKVYELFDGFFAYDFIDVAELLD